MNGLEFWKRIEILSDDTVKVTKIAKFLGVRQSTVFTMYKNKTMPKVDIAYKIAQYLGCTIDYLLTGEKGDSLNPTEKELIENYRNCDRFMKIAIESTARDGATREKNTRTEEKSV